MQAYVAEIGEIVRAQRRDEEELEEIQERISRVLKELGGQRVWILLFPYIPVFAKTVYYSSTVLSGTQTLGEEYIRLVESQGLSKIAPSFPTRILFLILHVFAPLLSQIALQKAQRKLNHPSTLSFLGICLRNNTKARRTFQKIIDWIRSIGIPQLYRLHLAVFYIFGAYYNISRRVVGIRFLSLNAQTDVKALKVYRILGYLTLVQTSISVIVWLGSILLDENRPTRTKTKVIKNSHNSGIVEDYFFHPWFRCSICLECRCPSSTPCGHLFCWSCIQEHALSDNSESRCPHCRKSFEPSQIVPLLNL